METVSSEAYDHFAVAYQRIEMERLNRILAEIGIADAGLRRDICGRYFFYNGLDLDSGNIKIDGQVLWPEIHFTQRDVTSEFGKGLVEKIYTWNESFTFQNTDFDEMFDEVEAGVAQIEQGYCRWE